MSEIIVSSNLYNDSEAFGLPRSIFFELVKILSFSLDFQRDIRKNTTFLVLYEKLYDYKNNLITTGKILYSKVLLKNDSIEMYLFKSNEILAKQIASLHNIRFYLWLMEQTRLHLKNGTFTDWKNKMVKKLNIRL